MGARQFDAGAVAGGSTSPPWLRVVGQQSPPVYERLAAGVFRAYRQEAVWCLKSQFTSLDQFDDMRGQGSTWDAFYHHALVTAIALMVEEDPALLADPRLDSESPLSRLA